jgi:hypothetical protein
MEVHIFSAQGVCFDIVGSVVIAGSEIALSVLPIANRFLISYNL